MGRKISSESVYVRALNGCYNIPTEHSESFPWSLSFEHPKYVEKLENWVIITAHLKKG